jgi:hypothetical protein
LIGGVLPASAIGSCCRQRIWLAPVYVQRMPCGKPLSCIRDRRIGDQAPNAYWMSRFSDMILPSGCGNLTAGRALLTGIL